jgi:RimJ/RimL family protein N-acetyltransferase
MMIDPDVMKHTGFRTPKTDLQIIEYLHKWIQESFSPLGVWCVEDKITSNCIGWFMLKPTDHKNPELGYMIAKSMWGNGFAFEVAKEI